MEQSTHLVMNGVKVNAMLISIITCTLMMQSQVIPLKIFDFFFFGGGGYMMSYAWLCIYMVEGYSLLSSAKHHSADFTQLPPGHRTCSFINHLNSLGSIQPDCHFSTQNYSSTQAFTALPGTHLLLRWAECTCGQSALPRSTMSEHNSAQPGTKPAISHL